MKHTFPPKPPERKLTRKQIRANMRDKIEQAEKTAKIGRHRRNDNPSILAEELDENEQGRWKHHAEQTMDRLWNGKSNYWS